MVRTIQHLLKETWAFCLSLDSQRLLAPVLLEYLQKPRHEWHKTGTRCSATDTDWPQHHYSQAGPAWSVSRDYHEHYQPLGFTKMPRKVMVRPLLPSWRKNKQHTRFRFFPAWHPNHLSQEHLNHLGMCLKFAVDALSLVLHWPALVKSRAHL